MYEKEKVLLEKIVEYFKKNLSKGYTLDSLKWALIKQGYSRTVVNQAIEIANKELAASAPVLKPKPVINYKLMDEENRQVNLKKSFFKKILDKFFY